MKEEDKKALLEAYEREARRAEQEDELFERKLKARGGFDYGIYKPVKKDFPILYKKFPVDTPKEKAALLRFLKRKKVNKQGYESSPFFQKLLENDSFVRMRSLFGYRHLGYYARLERASPYTGLPYKEIMFDILRKDYTDDVMIKSIIAEEYLFTGGRVIFYTWRDHINDLVKDMKVGMIVPDIDVEFKQYPIVEEGFDMAYIYVGGGILPDDYEAIVEWKRRKYEERKAI